MSRSVKSGHAVVCRSCQTLGLANAAACPSIAAECSGCSGISAAAGRSFSRLTKQSLFAKSTPAAVGMGRPSLRAASEPSVLRKHGAKRAVLGPLRSPRYGKRSEKRCVMQRQEHGIHCSSAPASSSRTLRARSVNTKREPQLPLLILGENGLARSVVHNASGACLCTEPNAEP